MPKKLTIVVDQRGWCGERRAQGIVANCPPDWQARIVHRNSVDNMEVDDVIFFTFPAGLMYRYVRKKKPDVKIVSNWVSCGWPHNTKRWEATLKISSWVICNSEHWWKKAKKENKTSHIVPGVDTKLFMDYKTERNKVLWCAGCAGSNGMRSDLKREQLAKEIFRKLKRRGIEGSMLIPDPHKLSTIKNTADMVDWYNTGKVLFVTSKREGVPNVALEAAACGCAVVGTSVGVLPQLLQNRKNGTITEPTVNDFVEAVQTNFSLYDNLMKHDIKNEIAKFDWSIVAPHYFEVFDRVLS